MRSRREARHSARHRAWWARVGIVGLLAAFLTGCGDSFFHPVADAGPATYELRLPAISLLFEGIEEGLSEAFTRADRVRVVVASESTTLADESVAIEGATDDIVLSMSVPMEGDAELPATVSVELLAGSLLLFVAESQVVLQRGRSVDVTLDPIAVPGGIALAPSPPPLPSIGDTAHLAGTVTFATGEPISYLPLAWSSLDPEIVDVSSNGIATAVSQGVARVRAAHGSFVAEMEVRVALVAREIEVFPTSLEVLEGDTETITLLARDAGGHAFEPTSVSWSSSDPTVATVSAGGAVTGELPGTSEVVVTVDEVEAIVPVTVRPRAVAIEIIPDHLELFVDDIVQVEVVARDARNEPIEPPDVEWAYSDPTVAGVSSSGLVQAFGAGEAMITATRDGVTAEAVVVVHHRVTSIEIIPQEIEILLDEDFPLEVIVLDSRGEPIEPPDVDWETSDATVALVSSSGVVRGVGVGEATITAARDGVSGEARVVVHPHVSAVHVVPDEVVLRVDDNTQLEAVVLDAHGQSITPPNVVWQSSDLTVATVAENGLVQGINPGTATITATRDGVSGEARVVVHPRVVEVIVSPPSLELSIGQSHQLEVVVLDSREQPVTPPDVAWASSNSSAVTVSQSGLVTGVGIGQATITATRDGVTGEAHVVVVGATPVVLGGLAVELSEGPDHGLEARFRLTINPRGISGTVRWTLTSILDPSDSVILEAAYPPGLGSQVQLVTSPVELRHSELLSVPGTFTITGTAFNQFGAAADTLSITRALLTAPEHPEWDWISEGSLVNLVITWDYPIGSGPSVVFQVERRSPGGTFAVVGSSSGTDWIDEEAFWLDPWEYRIRACTMDLVDCSPYSQILHYDITDGAVAAPPRPPGGLPPD